MTVKRSRTRVFATFGLLATFASGLWAQAFDVRPEAVPWDVMLGGYYLERAEDGSLDCSFENDPNWIYVSQAPRSQDLDFGRYFQNLGYFSFRVADIRQDTMIEEIFVMTGDYDIEPEGWEFIHLTAQRVLIGGFDVHTRGDVEVDIFVSDDNHDIYLFDLADWESYEDFVTVPRSSRDDPMSAVDMNQRPVQPFGRCPGIEHPEL